MKTETYYLGRGLLFGLLLGMALTLSACTTHSEKVTQQFLALKAEFIETFPQFNIPSLTLSYITNLQNIQSLDDLQQQNAFFTEFQDKLSKVEVDYLSQYHRMEYGMLDFECQLHHKRLALEINYRENDDERPIDEKGLYFNPNGKAWYAYFIQRWIGAMITPEDLMAFGEQQVQQVQMEIQQIQQDLGYAEDSLGFYEHLNESQFFEPSPDKVMAGFQERKKVVRERLWEQFDPWDLPEENIAQGTSARLSHVPGFYNNQQLTFYFNLFDEPYNIRQYDWLYIHEAVPGHHFQISLVRELSDSLTDLQNIFSFPGYVEGWAAYTEEIGESLGLYRSPYDWMGKHEWNLVRSVRVVLDVGINYLGWSDEKALAYWKANVYNQDDIAMREIKRMQRWPGQVHTYKYGASQILAYRKHFEEQSGTSFDPKAFHRQILNQGPMPWSVLEELLF